MAVKPGLGRFQHRRQLVDGYARYYNTSTAGTGSANIINFEGGHTEFYDTSTAGNANIRTDWGGRTDFYNTSTAGNATFTNNQGGFLYFNGSSTAGNAIITNTWGEDGADAKAFTKFYDDSSAGQARIRNADGGYTKFDDNSNARDATIENYNYGFLNFYGSSRAGNAIITNDGKHETTWFTEYSSADNAIITNGGALTFNNWASGGTARYIGIAGTLNIAALATGGTTIGSLEGTGSVVLGSKTLTVGGNNLSTTFSGVISGTGALVKSGNGTLTLTGTNTYSGGTTVSGGTLQGNTTSLRGNIVNNAAVSFDQPADGTYAGAISGTGGVNKYGDSMLTLTGANSYSGVTKVQQGILKEGAPNAFSPNSQLIVDPTAAVIFFPTSSTTLKSMTMDGSLSLGGGRILAVRGTVQVGGTMVVERGGALAAATLSSSGTITNSTYIGTTSGGFTNWGTYMQVGDRSSLVGDFTNFGTATLSGGWVIGEVANSGIYSVTGAVANFVNGGGYFDNNSGGTLAIVSGGSYRLSAGRLLRNFGRVTNNGTYTGDVSNTGVLGGSGTFIGTVTNAGFVAPGNSIGTMIIDGSYTQLAGSTYQVEANAAGQADHIKVQPDRINLIPAPGTATIAGGTVQALPDPGIYAPSTTYTILNATGGVSGTYTGVSSPYPFLQPSLSYDSSNVYLTLRPGGFSAGAATANQSAVGSALDRGVAGAGGDFATVIGTMATYSQAQGQAAMSALSGQNYSGFGTANVGSGQMFMNVLGQQMSLARGGLGKGIRVSVAQACELDAEACNGEATPWSLWGSGLGGTGSVSGNGNSGTLSWNGGGVATGIDYRFDPRFLAGIAVGFISGNQWVSGFSGQGTTSSYQASLYASFTSGALYFDALAGYGYNDNQMTRQIVLPNLASRVAQGRTGSNQFLGQAEVGYRIGIYELAAASITPFARFEGTTVSQMGFGESGAGSLNLNVAAQTTGSARSVLGAELAGSFGIDGREKLAMQLRLGWAHEYASTTRPVTASFAGAPGSNFTVYGAAPQTDAAIVSLSAGTAIAPGVSLYLRYDGEMATGTSSHALNGGLRMTW